jgi:hypothetical protein
MVAAARSPLPGNRKDQDDASSDNICGYSPPIADDRPRSPDLGPKAAPTPLTIGQRGGHYRDLRGYHVPAVLRGKGPHCPDVL